MKETQASQLADEFRDSYVVCADGSHGGGELRYVAVARRLGTRPYALVTSDPDELRQALARSTSAPAASGGE
jgi:hypothetical protein